MKKRLLAMIAVMALSVGMIVGCGSKDTSNGSTASKTEQKEDTAEDKADAKASTSDEASTLTDGIYHADFTTDSAMFHVNEANNGKGTLTVKDGKMTIHISLASQNILNLFVGTAGDAQKDGAELLEPTTDTVTYSDGATEEVYGFDVPVPSLDTEFDLALIGTKGKWYDHKVTVSNPEAAE